MASSSSKAASGDVWAFDFDGVVCDSVGESAISAWEVRKKAFPLSLFLQKQDLFLKTLDLSKNFNLF